MYRSSYRGSALSLIVVLLLCAIPAVPAIGAQMPQSTPTYTTGTDTTVTGCGVQNAPRLSYAPVVDGDSKGVTLNADGSRLYVSRDGKGDNAGRESVLVLDAQTLGEIAEMPLPGYYAYPGRVVLNPSGTKGYVPTYAPSVQVFDTSRNTMTTTIPVYQMPEAIRFSRDGSKAYVVHYNNTITVIDTQTDTVQAVWNYDITYGTFRDIQLDPTGAYAYVAGGQKWAVLVVDLLTGSIVDEIPLGGPAGPMALTRDGSVLYVMDRYNQRTLVLDMSTRGIRTSFPVVGQTLILSESENRAYIPTLNLNNIAVIDLTVNALICSHWLLPTGVEMPYDIALGPGNHHLYTVSVASPNSVSAFGLPAEQDPAFTDVPRDSAFYREITWLAAAGVTTGYDDHTFRPLEQIHRDAMAAFLYRFHGSPEFAPPQVSPFTDVSPSDKFYKEITWLASMKITQGWPDGTFRPLEPVNRDAMAAFLYRTVDHARFIPPAESPFADVRTDDPFYVPITFLGATGVATGWPDGTFRPLTPVNRDAMAAFLFRLNPMAAQLMR